MRLTVTDHTPGTVYKLLLNYVPAQGSDSFVYNVRAGEGNDSGLATVEIIGIVFPIPNKKLVFHSISVTVFISSK